MRIYCISGLGADEKAFTKLHISGVELVHIAWVPFDKGNDLPSYASKLISQIIDERPVIMGLSFGGMLAVEISKLIPVKKLILISSAKTKHELPDYGSWFRWLVTSEIVPLFMYRLHNPYLNYLFGVKTKEEIRLLKYIISYADPHFVRGAMRAIAEWKNETYPQSLVHIHGTADKILPAKNVRADYWIDGGEHFMIYSQADEVSRIIEKEITHLT